MNIILIRHGESTQNVYENYDKLPDALVPLTQNGINQAKSCGEYLKEYCKTNKINLNNSIMYVSPLARTVQTAQYVNEYLKIQNVKQDPLLTERQFGLFDTLKFEERKQYKESFDYATWMYKSGANFYAKYPLGESNFDVYTRARLFLQSVIDKETTENIFIVSHGGFLKCFNMAYMGYDINWHDTTPYMENCDVILLKNISNQKIDNGYIYSGVTTQNTIE